MSIEWNAEWIGMKTEDRFHPVFKKEFRTEKKIRSALLRITGVGLFEAWVDGRKISDEYLTPYFNDYQTGIQLFEFDVTEMIASGNENHTLEVYLGNGWYKGRFTMIPGGNLYGDHFALTAELILEEERGERRAIPTDESWTYRGSDVEESGIYDGEVFHRLLWDGKENPERQAVVLKMEKPVIERYSLPVVVKETLPVKEIIKTQAGETVLDFGQNFAGFVSFESRMKRGERVRLEFGEVLQGGNFYNENYKSARGGFSYVSDGRKETVRPHFTFFGGRYVKVSGDLEGLDLNRFTGCVIYSDMERTGFVETSNEKLNRVYENALWSQKCNFIDIPTDCPQRDERMAWCGDINVFAKTASYNMNTKNFLMKFLRDLRAQQVRDGGAVAAVLPSFGPAMVSSVWSDAATFLPWTLYEMYGETEILEKNYDLMKDWVDWIDRQDAARGKRQYLYNFGFHFGDWLAMDGSTDHSMKGGTEDFYIASAYYYASSKILASAAAVLGKTEDAEHYEAHAEKIKGAFLDEYYTRNGRLAIDTQAAYVVALRFGLYMDKERITRAFRLRLKKDCYQIRCGFVGGTYLCQALGENGMEDLAYRLLLNEEYPGWINEVNLGATTIWERWNTVLPDGTINPSEMNSCNHYAYGSVAEFLYAVAAGIRPAAPGFQEIELKPIPDKRLRQLKCRYRSVKGEIVSEWEVQKDGSLKLRFEVPEGSFAKLTLPYTPSDFPAQQRLEAGTHEFHYMPVKDFAHKFDEDSIVKDIAKDPEAMAMVSEVNQGLAFMMQGADEEAGTETLFGFTANPFSPATPEEVRRIVERLKQLRCLAE